MDDFLEGGGGGGVGPDLPTPDSQQIFFGFLKIL